MPDHSAVEHPNTDILNKAGIESDEDFRMQASEVLKAAQISRWPGGNTMPAAGLWDKQRMFIFVVRRPGCQFCRAHAILIGYTKMLLSKLGFGFAAIVASTRQDEIEGFAQRAWMGKIYLDNKFAFLTALGQNEVKLQSLKLESQILIMYSLDQKRFLLALPHNTFRQNVDAESQAEDRRQH